MARAYLPSLVFFHRFHLLAHPFYRLTCHHPISNVPHSISRRLARVHGMPAFPPPFLPPFLPPFPLSSPFSFCFRARHTRSRIHVDLHFPRFFPGSAARDALCLPRTVSCDLPATCLVFVPRREFGAHDISRVNTPVYKALDVKTYGIR